MQQPQSVAVITGRHPYDVPAFQRMLRALPGIDAYPQSLEDLASDASKARDSYDALVFYNFHQETPGEQEAAWWEGDVKASLERIGQTQQGVVILHHALMAFRQWPFWSTLVGIAQRGRGYCPNVEMIVEIAAPDHPITQGLAPWTMVDESYTIDEPDPGMQILLTTQNPNSMRALAWAHMVGQARVFCYAAGHDAQAYNHPVFRTVLSRGIAWVTRRI